MRLSSWRRNRLPARTWLRIRRRSWLHIRWCSWLRMVSGDAVVVPIVCATFPARSRDLWLATLADVGRERDDVANHQTALLDHGCVCVNFCTMKGEQFGAFKPSAAILNDPVYSTRVFPELHWLPANHRSCELPHWRGCCRLTTAVHMNLECDGVTHEQGICHRFVYIYTIVKASFWARHATMVSSN